MSIPMALENPNFIVGDALYEFLCLGCRHGYSLLGNLHLNQDQVIRSLENPPEPFFDDRSEAVLQTLSDEFSLSPWKQAGARLAELQNLYAKTLRLATPPI